MLKLKIDKVRMHVGARYRVEGSVLNDSVEAGMVAVETRLEIQSPEPAEKIARLVRNAERGCFVMQALQKPVAIASSTVLNGRPL
jgi:organic hydroperoxide reductase OsmC/OhrA